MTKKILPLLLLLLLLAACGGNKKGDKRIITVTIEPLEYFTEQITGKRFEVRTMVPRGSNPETYEPTPQQMIALSHSDLYIKVGNIGFERTWMNRLESNAPHTIVIDSSDGIIPVRTCDGIPDPHVWMSTVNAAIIARNIYKAVVDIDARDSLFYKANLETFLARIAATDTRVREMLTKDKSTVFMIYHPALTYFARDYSLTQLPIEEEGREPSAAQLRALIAEARLKRVKTIFVQKQFSNRNTAVIAQSTGAEQQEIDVLNYNWEQEMTTIAKKLK